MTLKECPALLKRSFNDWNDDNAPRLGAALAFYTILSISPLVILVIAIVSVVFDRSKAQAHLLNQVQAIMGPDGRNAVQTMLASGQKASSGIFATLLGLATLVFGASGVFGELRSALNTIWEAKPKASSGLWGLLRERFFSIGMVFSVGFVLLVSLLASAGLAAVTTFFKGFLPIPSIVLGSLNFVVSFLGIAVLFGFILKYVPETKVEWRDVRIGALATALLFTIGKSLLGLYLGKASPGSAYGAAGSLVVMVIWVYYSAQIFFFGAEFTHVYALSERGALDSEPHKGEGAKHSDASVRD
ncbi:MAG: YihY/virulence factor BrkB family protein [Janthinobacterium lividum]